MTKRRLAQYIREFKKVFSDGPGQELVEQLGELVQSLPDDSWTKSQTPGEYPLPKEFKNSTAEFALFSDGACRGNPGPGSWGMMGQDRAGKVIFESSGVEMLTTNNRMELVGAIEALKQLAAYCTETLEAKLPYDGKIFLYSDSRYVLDGLDKWIDGWKARGWKKADKKSPENLEYWQEIDQLREKFPKLEYVWIKGHSGHPQNERCDGLANEALDLAGL